LGRVIKKRCLKAAVEKKVAADDTCNNSAGEKSGKRWRERRTEWKEKKDSEYIFGLQSL
jgi:hypothetical protein